MLLKLWEVLLLNRNDTIIPYNQYRPWLKSDVTDATQWDVNPWFVIFYFSYKLNPSWPQEYVVKFNSDKTNYQQKQPFFPLIVWVPFLFSFDFFVWWGRGGDIWEKWRQALTRNFSQQKKLWVWNNYLMRKEQHNNGQARGLWSMV